jgi:hypothetical protein
VRRSRDGCPLHTVRNSLFGAENSLFGRGKFPVPPCRELPPNALICHVNLAADIVTEGEFF